MNVIAITGSLLKDPEVRLDEISKEVKAVRFFVRLERHVQHKKEYDVITCIAHAEQYGVADFVAKCETMKAGVEVELCGGIRSYLDKDTGTHVMYVEPFQIAMPKAQVVLIRQSSKNKSKPAATPINIKDPTEGYKIGI